MREISVSATVERTCSASPEAILAWERDPFAVASVDTRTRVTGYVATDTLVGSRWTMVVTMAGFLRMREQQSLMSLDPVIVETRAPRQSGTLTVTARAVADEDGGSEVTYRYALVLKLPPVSHLIYSRRTAGLQRKLSARLTEYVDKSVAAIEAHAAHEATGAL